MSILNSEIINSVFCGKTMIDNQTLRLSVQYKLSGTSTNSLNVSEISYSAFTEKHPASVLCCVVLCCSVCLSMIESLTSALQQNR